MMTILFINMYYYPNMMGGTEYSIKILAESLAKRGNRVMVYTQDGNSKGLSPETINGVVVHRGFFVPTAKSIKKTKLTIVDRIVRALASIINPCVYYDLRRIIRTYKPDIIHTNNLMSMSIYPLLIKNTRHIHTLRDYWLLDPKIDLTVPNSLRSVIHRFFFRTVTNRVRITVTAPSERTIQIFKNYGFFRSSKMVCIPNCIRIQDSELMSIVENKLKRDHSSIGYIYVGKLDKYKGLDMLIEAFMKMRDYSATLSVCGDGPLREEVVKATYLDNRICYLGHLSQEELIRKYKESDILIVPSKWEEPFGRIIIEGAQYGLAVIGSNKGGIPEIISVLKNGMIFDSSNTTRLLECMREIVKNNNLSNYVAAIPKSISFYSLDRQLSLFESLYQEL